MLHLSCVVVIARKFNVNKEIVFSTFEIDFSEKVDSVNEQMRGLMCTVADVHVVQCWCKHPPPFFRFKPERLFHFARDNKRLYKIENEVGDFAGEADFLQVHIKALEP